VNECNLLKIVEMKGVDYGIVYLSEEDTDIESSYAK